MGRLVSLVPGHEEPRDISRRNHDVEGPSLHRREPVLSCSPRVDPTASARVEFARRMRHSRPTCPQEQHGSAGGCRSRSRRSSSFPVHGGGRWEQRSARMSSAAPRRSGNSASAGATVDAGDRAHRSRSTPASCPQRVGARLAGHARSSESACHVSMSPRRACRTSGPKGSLLDAMKLAALIRHEVAHLEGADEHEAPADRATDLPGARQGRTR